MKHARKWQRMLERKYDSHMARQLIRTAEGMYDQAWAGFDGEGERGNRNTLRTRILPVYAIYRSLLEESGDRECVLAEVEGLMRDAFFEPMLTGIRMLNLLPDPFPIIRPVLRWMTRGDDVPGSQEIIEDSRDCFALNVYRCYTLDILTKLGAPELTPLFCDTDDWLSAAMPKIRWERTKTLGRGDAVCDFRWCRRRKIDLDIQQPNS